MARIEDASWGPFNGATKLKYSPRPYYNVNRIKWCDINKTAKETAMRFYAASGFGWCFFFSPQLRKTIQSGLAMKIDE